MRSHLLIALFAPLLLVLPAPVVAQDSADETDDGLNEPIDDIGREHRASSGAGLTIGVGANAGFRSMEFSGSNGTLEHSPSPYFGGLVDLALDLHYFQDAEAGLRLEAIGGYLTASDSEPDPVLGRPLVAQATRIGATAVVSRALRPSWDLRIGAGIERLSHSIEKNDVYTGHTYWSLQFAAGIEWWNDTDTLRFLAELEFLPGLSVEQSDGRYGNASAFGTRANIEGAWFFYRPNGADIANAAELLLRLDATRHRAQFPSGGIVGARATSKDDFAAVALAIRYHL